MATNLYRLFTTAALSAAFALGGLGVAVAHHGNASEHSTTKGKSLAEIERLERQITADLNRKSAMQGAQLAMQVPMTDVMPDEMTNIAPETMPTDEQASLTDEEIELAAVEEEEAVN